MDRKRIAHLISSLDHPDLITRQEVEDELAKLGPEAISAIGASFSLYQEPRVVVSLVTVLQKIGDPKGILPLMRFIYDTRDRIALSDARGLAMRAIDSMAKPDHADKLFQFLLDIIDDRDAFVRGYAATTLGKFGDRRAVGFLKELAGDEHEFVREKATEALQGLEKASSDALKQDVSDEDLIDLIVANKGAEQEFYVQELRERDTAFELAAVLTRKPARGRLRGLQVLYELADPRARGVVTTLLQSKTTEAERALALRILGHALNGDANEDEIDVIGASLMDSDEYVVAAGMLAAGGSGDITLMEKALKGVAHRSPEVRLAAAKGLASGANTSARAIFPKLEDLVKQAQQRRLRDESDVNVRTEAYLLRTISKTLGDSSLGAAKAQQIALRALLDARDKRPLVITALELLNQTTPEDGLREDDRWHRQMILGLVDLIEIEETDLRNRAMDLLVRGGPKRATEWVEPISKQIYEVDAEHMEARVIPLLERAGNGKAKQLLKELSETGDDIISIAAAAALRRLRDDQEFIDAEFE